MNRLYIASLFFIFRLSSIYSFGQEIYSISGTVKDSLSGELLIGATIYEVNTNKAVISNKFGFFSIQLPVGDVHLKISYVGFTTYQLETKLKSNITIDVRLIEGVFLTEVQVTAVLKKISQSDEMSVVRIPIKQLELLPSLFGEADIMSAMQHMPGIQSSGEGKTEINVRGGSPDQNLILLDDIPLYNVSHFGGFLSTFNTSALKDVTLYKGGFPARYGGRLSSVIDVRMKDGDLNNYNVEGMLGLLSCKLMIDGPIVKGKSSFLISARKNTLPVFKLIYNEPIAYNFYDLNLKINTIINQKDRIFLSFYTGNDKLKVKQESDFAENGHSEMLNYSKWGNIGGAFRWNHIFGSKLFLNTTLGISSYHYLSGIERLVEFDTIRQHVTNDFISKVNDYFIKIEPEYQVFEFWKIHFGMQSTMHSFYPGSIDFSKDITNSEDVRSYYNNEDVTVFENSIYLENRLEFFKKINANLGLHYSNYQIINGKQYSSFEPRIILNYNFIENISVKASYTLMKQYIHFLTYSGTGMPSDFWMPSTNNVNPQNSNQYALGLAVSLFDNQFEASIESYYKTMDNLIAFRAGESMFASNESWEDKIEKYGTGYSKGIEFLLQKQQGKTSGWFSLTCSKSERKFENINNGNAFPFKFDRRYAISLVVVQQLKKGITFSASWDFGSGYPITLPLEKYNSFKEEVWVYSDINSFRMNNYHRLDIGINFFKKTRWGERIWNISIYNLYNRKNPYYYYTEREQIQKSIVTPNNGVISTMVEGNMKLYQQSLYSFFPSFSYTFKF